MDVILVSVQVPLVLTLGLWTWDIGLGLDNIDNDCVFAPGVVVTGAETSVLLRGRVRVRVVTVK